MALPRVSGLTLRGSGFSYVLILTYFCGQKVGVFWLAPNWSHVLSGAGVGVGSTPTQPHGLRKEKDHSKKAIGLLRQKKGRGWGKKNKSSPQKECPWTEEQASHLFRLEGKREGLLPGGQLWRCGVRMGRSVPSTLVFLEKWRPVHVQRAWGRGKLGDLWARVKVWKSSWGKQEKELARNKRIANG